MLRGIEALRRHNGGSVSIIFMASLIPMLVVLGAAVDLGRAYSYRTKLNAAADSAALSATRAANEYLAANGTGTTQQDAAKQVALAAAQRFINARAAEIAMIGAPQVTVDVQIAGRQATVKASIQGYIKSSVLNVVGIDQLRLYAASTATMEPATEQYYQILFLVDVSNSMAIGGTQADITALQNNASIGCAFACHDSNNFQASGGSCGGTTGGGWTFTNFRWVYVAPTQQPTCDKRALARAAKITLKIDYVNTAVNSFISKLSALNASSTTTGRYYVGIKTFGTTYNSLLPITNNLTTAATTAATLDVESAVSSSANYGYTYVTNSMTQFTNELTNVGDGSSATKRKTYVIFLSDGVEDVPGNMGWGRSTGLAYKSACTTLKAKGVSVFSIWAGYTKIADDNQYMTIVDPLSSQLPGSMLSCASSPAQYFLATDGPGIQAAVDSTFHQISSGSNLRLTQ